MRKLITIILILVCSKSFAQVYQLMPQYGYQAPRMAFDSTLQIPTFCGVPTLKSVQFVTKKAAIAFDSCNNRFYQYNPKTLAWSVVSGSSTDTTSLSNRINLKIDSIKSRNDSVFAYKLGTAFFQYKDTTIGTLQSVTNKGNTTTNDISANSFTSSGGAIVSDDGSMTAQSYEFLNNGGSLQSIGVGVLWKLPNYSDTLVGESRNIDSIKRRIDSVFAYKNGTEVFQFKDSVGGGGGSFLPLSGGTLTGNLNGTTATFSSNGSTNTFNINHTSGSGHGLEITKAGSGEGLIVNKTSGSGNAVTITGTLNATTIVKNGGTSSQFLKADGSVDATNYLIDTSSLSSRINLKYNTTDTSSLQQKSLPANSFMANNTASQANPTATTFKQFGNQTYTDSITITGASNPSGAINHTFRYSQFGNLVTLHITLTYASNGSLSQVAMELPDGLPIPILPTGLTANNDIICYGTGFMVSTTTGVSTVFSKVFLRQNTGLTNDYEIVINQATNSSYRIMNATIQYFAQ